MSEPMSILDIPRCAAINDGSFWQCSRNGFHDISGYQASGTRVTVKVCWQHDKMWMQYINASLIVSLHGLIFKKRPEGTYPVVTDSVCTCSRIAIGMKVSENRNWKPGCPEHGLNSEWYAKEGKARIEESNRLAVEMQKKARKAREAARNADEAATRSAVDR